MIEHFLPILNAVFVSFYVFTKTLLLLNTYLPFQEIHHITSPMRHRTFLLCVPTVGRMVSFCHFQTEISFAVIPPVRMRILIASYSLRFVLIVYFVQSYKSLFYECIRYFGIGCRTIGLVLQPGLPLVPTHGKRITPCAFAATALPAGDKLGQIDKNLFKRVLFSR